MRCPNCRKKVHADDIYCIWCSEPLQRSITPADILSSEKVRPEADSAQYTMGFPKKEKRPRLRVYILIFILVLLVGFVISLLEWNGVSHRQPETITLVIPENAEPLDVLLAQWEGFTLWGDYIVLDDIGETLEIFFTAENRMDDTVICGDPLVSIEGYQLRGNMYLELPPGESALGQIRIEMEPLQSVGFHRVRELILAIPLFNAEDESLLTQMESGSVCFDWSIPQRNIQPENATILEESGLYARLTGIATNPETGEIRLYTLLENRSEETHNLHIKNLRWEGAALCFSNYHILPPGIRLLVCYRIYGVPSDMVGQMSLEIITGAGEVHKCTIVLTAEGTIAEVKSETE